MSLWGLPYLAPNAKIFPYYYFNLKECLDKTIHVDSLLVLFKLKLNVNKTLLPLRQWKDTKIKIYKKNCIYYTKNLSSNSIIVRANQRIGPHNKNLLSIFFGSLLGDGQAEFRNKGNGTRITFYQEASHTSYLIWLHAYLSNLGYCSSNRPKIKTRLGKKGVVRKIFIFKTYTYSSLNWVHEIWYLNGKKIVPNNIGEYLTPLALAIWIMEDGVKVGQDLKLSTNSFTYLECLLLVKVLYNNFKIKASVESAGIENQSQINIWTNSMPLLREIVKPYVHSSMKYKLGL